MIFETHAHLNSSRFDEDREAVIEKLKEAGVDLLINVGDTLASSRECIELAEQYAFIYAAVGVHPESAGEERETYIATLSEMSKHEKVRAIGEIGLDYHFEDNPPREVQREVFDEQLSLAKELSLPVIVHSRDAAEDTFDILSGYAGRVPVVLHCYSYSPEFALRAVKELDACIGVGGVVTFNNAKKLVKTVESLPLDRILLETDCPYMAPAPFRGERNDPSMLPYIARRIGEIKGVSFEEVCFVTHENAERFFRK